MLAFSFFSLYGSKLLLAAVCVAVLAIAWQLIKAAKKPERDTATIMTSQCSSSTIKASTNFEVFQHWAVITMPQDYELVDMAAIIEFLRSDLFRGDKREISFILYDCAKWRWSNVLGLELCLPQYESNWKGEIIFCGAKEVRWVLDQLLEDVAEVPSFRLPHFFDTLAEGLEYAKDNSTAKRHKH